MKTVRFKRAYWDCDGGYHSPDTVAEVSDKAAELAIRDKIGEDAETSTPVANAKKKATIKKESARRKKEKASLKKKKKA